MSNWINFFQAFGHYTRNWSQQNDTYPSAGKTKEANILNGLGLLPGLGVGTAIERWYRVSQGDLNENLPIKVGLIVRGIFEFLGLGFIVLLFVDLPVDCARYCCNKNDAGSKNNLNDSIAN